MSPCPPFIAPDYRVRMMPRLGEPYRWGYLNWPDGGLTRGNTWYDHRHAQRVYAIVRHRNYYEQWSGGGTVTVSVGQRAPSGGSIDRYYVQGTEAFPGGINARNGVSYDIWGGALDYGPPTGWLSYRRIVTKEIYNPMPVMYQCPLVLGDNDEKYGVGPGASVDLVPQVRKRCVPFNTADLFDRKYDFSTFSPLAYTERVPNVYRESLWDGIAGSIATVSREDTIARPTNPLAAWFGPIPARSTTDLDHMLAWSCLAWRSNERMASDPFFGILEYSYNSSSATLRDWEYGDVCWGLREAPAQIYRYSMLQCISPHTRPQYSTVPDMTKWIDVLEKYEGFYNNPSSICPSDWDYAIQDRPPVGTPIGGHFLVSKIAHWQSGAMTMVVSAGENPNEYQARWEKAIIDPLDGWHHGWPYSGTHINKFATIMWHYTDRLYR